MDNWLNDTIRVGLAKLLCLRLDGCPPDDLIEGTAQAWLDAVKHGMAWDEHRDRHRFEHAFRTLAKTCLRWPAPAMLLAAMPKPDGLRLAHKPGIVPPAVAARNVARLRAVLGPIADPPRDEVDRKTAAGGPDA